jgi:predicted deacylase
MQEIGDCVWTLASGRPGPHLLILGGVHGNELSGIVVVRELLARFERSPGDLVAGTLTLAFGNPAAIARGTRGSAPHRDLNRSFLPERMADRSVYEHRRAAELAPRIDAADILLDMHATNKPSEPFLATTLLTPEHERLAQAFACDRLLVVSPDAIPGTTDSRINGRGVGFVYESGLASDLACLQAVRDAVDAAMAMLGLAAGPLPPPRAPKTVYALTEALLLTEHGFRFADGRGLCSFEPMAKGDVIGFTGTVPVLAPYDGVLMFPKVPELWKIGSPLAFFAERR